MGYISPLLPATCLIIYSRYCVLVCKPEPVSIALWAYYNRLLSAIPVSNSMGLRWIFLSSQVMLQLVIWRPHFKNHCSSEISIERHGKRVVS